jgi:hypothetical protein
LLQAGHRFAQKGTGLLLAGHRFAPAFGQNKNLEKDDFFEVM